MKFHYGGYYKNEEDLKSERENPKGAVPFKEPAQNVFALVANIGCFILAAGLLAIVYIGVDSDRMLFFRNIGKAALLSMFVLLPHEFLHATCFKEDVYLYFNPAKFLIFVHGTESMSKRRFIFMSLLPNIVFGLIPFIIFLINRDMCFWGIFGALNLGMGFGDYINVFNATIQMPKGSMTYLNGFHSYWYKDEGTE